MDLGSGLGSCSYIVVLDEWYAGNPMGGKTGPRWDYSKVYAQGSNGD